MSNEEKKLTHRQFYTIEVLHFDNGESIMNRDNDGFSVFELLGITEMVRFDLMALLREDIGPKISEVNRVGSNSPIHHHPDAKNKIEQ